MKYTLEQTPFLHSTKFTGSCLHLGVSGSIACYKSADLLRAFLNLQMHVSATLTAGAQKFVSSMLFKSLGADPVYSDMFMPENDTFAHLEPGAKAGVFLVCPASANLIARLALGFASDMLSAQALAFQGHMVLAPAMNPRMWKNPVTQNNISSLQKNGRRVVGPVEGVTACGEAGLGKLADLPAIFLETLKAFTIPDMAGLKVLTTLGPTREFWDGVRFWSNPSSGLMGSALATCAFLRGAEVYALCGPGISVFLPEGIKRIDVVTARDMFTEAQKLWPQMNIGCFCAAVADFSPLRPENADFIKVKKEDFARQPQILFGKNPDIIKSLAVDKKPDQKVLGFAAELAPSMEALLPLAQDKLKSKNADLLAANRVNAEDGAFGSQENRMAVVDFNGTQEIWSPQSKADIAWDLLSWLLRL